MNNKPKHSSEFKELVEIARANTSEVTIDEALSRAANGATLIDIREDSEWQDGNAKGAIHIGRGVLERDIVQTIPDKEAELILYCRGGMRSILAAETLQKMGYTKVYSMTGGWRAWVEADLPQEVEAKRVEALSY